MYGGGLNDALREMDILVGAIDDGCDEYPVADISDGDLDEEDICRIKRLSL
jgi:hypothetical protein